MDKDSMAGSGPDVGTGVVAEQPMTRQMGDRGPDRKDGPCRRDGELRRKDGVPERRDGG